MLQFQTLGTLNLRNRSGARLTAVLAHPKRVALLLYLVLEGNGRPVERDLLISLLWPDAPADRARGSLRTALSAMRTSLGDGVLDADSQHVSVRLDSMVCDSVVLLEAAAASNWERGAEVAKAPLAQGFQIADLGEFDRWLDRQRERIRRAATQTLRAAAEACAETDVGRAEGHLECAAIHSPFDEALLEQRLRLLVARGDRTGATELFQRWSADLRATLEIDPSPELESLHRSIVSGAPSLAAGGRVSRPVLVPHETPAASTAAASNPASTPTTDTQPRSGGQLETQRGRSPLSRNFARFAVPVAAAATILAMAWIGSRAGADESTQATERNSVPVAASRPAPPTAPVMALVDSGVASYRRGDYERAVAKFTAALEADPDYSRALYGQALTAYAAGRTELAIGAANAMEALRPWMSPAENRRLDALQAAPDEARAIYAELRKSEPDNLDLVIESAELDFHYGSYWGVPRETVRKDFERLASGFAPLRAAEHLMRMDAADGDLQAARARLRAMERGGATASDLLVGRALVALLDPEKEPPIAEIAAATPRQISLVAGAVAAFTVRPDAVDDFLRRMYDAVPEPMRLDLALWNAIAAVARGRLTDTEDWLTKAESFSPARADEFRAAIATLPWLPANVARWNEAARMLQSRKTARLVGPYADDIAANAIYSVRKAFLMQMTELPKTGDDAPYSVFDSLPQKTAVDLSLGSAFRDILRARRVLVSETDGKAALDILGPPKVPSDRSYPSLLHYPFAVGRFMRTRALIAAGRTREAYDWLRSWPDPAGYDRAYLPEMLTLRADLAGMLGNQAEAQRYYRRAAALLRGADPAFRPKQLQIAGRLKSASGTSLK